MGNKCCRSIKAKYFSNQETQITHNSEFYEDEDEDEFIITKDEMIKMMKMKKIKKASSDSFSLFDLEIEISNTKNELAQDSYSLEFLIRDDHIDSKPKGIEVFILFMFPKIFG